MTSHIAETNCVEIDFTINGKHVTKTIRHSTILLDLIRDELDLKGTKPGCGEGECGACTVLIDGCAVNSCLYLAINVHGKSVTTVEGISSMDSSGLLHPVQEALIQHGAVQCGFCTPGMVMSIASFHNECETQDIIPDREKIKKALEGNLCRCTGYTKIINAVESLFR